MDLLISYIINKLSFQKKIFSAVPIQNISDGLVEGQLLPEVETSLYSFLDSDVLDQEVFSVVVCCLENVDECYHQFEQNWLVSDFLVLFKELVKLKPFLLVECVFSCLAKKIYHFSEEHADAVQYSPSTVFNIHCGIVKLVEIDLQRDFIKLLLFLDHRNDYFQLTWIFLYQGYHFVRGWSVLAWNIFHHLIALLILLLLLFVLLILFNQCHYLAPGWLKFLFGDWRCRQLVAFQQALSGLVSLRIVSFASGQQTIGLLGD